MRSAMEVFRLQEGSSHLRSFMSNKLIQRHATVRSIPNFFATVSKRNPVVKSFNAFFRNSADAFFCFIKLSPESCLTFWGQFSVYGNRAPAGERSRPFSHIKEACGFCVNAEFTPTGRPRRGARPVQSPRSRPRGSSPGGCRPSSGSLGHGRRRSWPREVRSEAR